MSSLKTDIISSENRMALNTTINKELLENFKARCKYDGIPMNTCLEAFMRQYLKGEFYLKFSKAGRLEMELK